MAVVFFDGFNSYQAGVSLTSPSDMVDNGWGVVGWSGSRIVTGGRYGTGARCFSVGSRVYTAAVQLDTGYLSRSYTAQSKASCGFAMRNLNSTVRDTNGSLMTFLSGTNINANFGIGYYPRRNYYYIYFNKTGFTTTYSTPIKNFNFADWHFYEFEMDFSQTGFAKVYVDGSLVLTVNGDMRSLSTNLSTSDNLRFYPTFRQSVYYYVDDCLFDDFYLTDTDQRLGDVNIITLRPSADTAQKQWVPSTGSSNYAMINSVQYSQTPTQYVTTNSVANDYYEFDDLPTSGIGVTGPIKAIRPNSYFSKTSIGDTQTSQIMKVGTTPIVGIATRPLEANMSFISTESYSVNPVTSSNWTRAEINSLTVGLSSVDRSNPTWSFSDGAINSGALTVLAGDTAPTITNGELVYTGTQNLRYADSPLTHIGSTFSMEIDFKTTDITRNQVVSTIGGNSTAPQWPELTIFYGNSSQGSYSGLGVYSASGNDAGSQVGAIAIPALVANTWYRLGIMIYSGRIRVYVNGGQKFDIPLNGGTVRDSTNGLSIGGDNSKDAARQFYGSIRNVSIGSALYWPI